MFGTLGTILLIVSMVLGGSGVTVAAAQNSLPGGALYPVKTWSEDVRTNLAGSSQSQFELALAFAGRRAEEMQVMLRGGQVPPEMVQARMQAEVDLALQLAAGQPDREAVQSLERVRQQLHDHERAMLEIRTGANTQAGAFLDQERAMVQDRLRLCDQGIGNLEWLRDHLRRRNQDGTGGGLPPVVEETPGGARNPWTTGTPTPGSGYGPGPGDSGANNPWTTGTPTPGSGYGPGPGDGSGGNNPWTTGTPTPGSGYGPGPGDGSGGNNPWTIGTPTPGSGYGPGPGGGAGDPGGAGDTGGSGTGVQGGGETDGGSGEDHSGTGGSDTGGNDAGSGGGTGSGGGGGTGGKH